MEFNRWTLLVGLLLSAWVFICPRFIEDAALPPASWNFYITGALGLLLSLVALMRPNDYVSYGLVAVGAWLVISPWILDLPDTTTRQVMLYGVALAVLGWIGRASYNPKEAEG